MQDDSRATLLQEFWKQKQHLFQLFGVVIAIGALFLAIPDQESNILAMRTLAYIKLVWLIIILFCLSILLVQCLYLVVRFEISFSKRELILDGQLVLLPIFLSSILIFLIVRYTWFSYKELIIHGLENSFFGTLCVWVISALVYSSIKRFPEFIRDPHLRFFAHCIWLLFNSFISTAVIYILYGNALGGFWRVLLVITLSHSLSLALIYDARRGGGLFWFGIMFVFSFVLFTLIRFL